MIGNDAVREDDDRQAKRRARWLRNKRTERARLKKPPPATLGPAVIEQIIAERNRRAADTRHPWQMHFGAHNHGWGTHDFHCDVWAARTILELMHEKSKISDGRIANWMAENGKTNGYAHGGRSSSLRTMVGRARKAIEILETAHNRRTGGPTWLPFNVIAEG